jgi:mannose-6-phosphate isomerase-like protein (cupin superfamily)/pyrroloquinoline quinone (PQQ) biosynthesis protein C
MRVEVTPEIQQQIDKLEAAKNNHSFWDNDLFKACKAGILSKEDFHYIFAQYYLYNKNFTRYLTAVMTNCENDYYRACLSENLWEEGGGAKPEERHTEMFRQFLIKTLEITDLDSIEFQDFSKLFTQEYLHKCMTNDAMYGSAFLSMGTEGMVCQLYTILVEGMVKAGIPDEELGFFHLHMECDDEHAETLAEMMASYADQPGWYGTCLKALDEALTLREKFFNNLFETLWLSRVHPIANDIMGRESTLGSNVDDYVVTANNGTALYNNKDDAQNIDFSVTRLPVPSQVLDPRINTIPAGKNTEYHSHGHETVIYIISGSGEVLIDGHKKPVSAGDTILVPRWCQHQTINSGNEDLVFLGITDYKLTGHFPGNSEHSYRANKAHAEKVAA